MKFSVATIIACAAIFAAAQDGGPGGPDAGGPPGGPLGGPPGGPHGGPHGPHPWEVKKHLSCPSSGGTATVSFPCPTGPPPTGKPSHPHRKPTGSPTGHKKWDGTITVFASDAPKTTKTLGIDCQGETGPSCSEVIFAAMTCAPPTNFPKPTDLPSDHPRFSHKSLPTVTASAGETETVFAHVPPTCKPSTATEA